MEKTILVVLLLGAALMSYSTVTTYFRSEDENNTCRSCDNIQAMVAWAEGNRACVYRDSLGIPTVGIGFNLQRSDARTIFSRFGIDYNAVLNGSRCLTDAQVTQLFNNDLTWARSGAARCVGSFANQPACVQNVLIDMTFNMGEGSLCGWPNFVAQLGRREYTAAANNMASTRWCGQVGRRCTRNTGIVRSC